MPAFEVLILELPTKKEVEENNALEKEKFYGRVIAHDPQGAGIVAIMENPDKIGDIDKNRIQVIVRPFVSGNQLDEK